MKKSFNIVAELSREDMEDMIAREEVNTCVSYSFHVDLSKAKDKKEAEWMVESVLDNMPDFDNDVDEIFKKLENKRKELKGRMFHELEEIGAGLGLWILEEKQKRLF